MKKIYLLSCLLIFGLSLFSQTQITGGMVSGTWNKSGNPYLIENTITLDYGQTLVIEEGCEIIFNPSVEFLINGTLMAEGITSDSIHFTSTTGWWSGLQIVGLWEYNHSVLDHCIIDNAETGLLTFYTGSVTITNSSVRNNGIGILIQHSSAYMNHIDVQDNTSTGIKMSGNCCNMEFFLTGFNIRNNGARGLDLEYDSGGTQEIGQGTIKNNAGGGIFNSSVDGFARFSDLLITQNGPADFGGGIHAYAACSIEQCRIENNSANLGGGIYFRTDYAIQNIEACVIRNNYALQNGGGIYLTDGATDISNSEISGNNADEHGGGIFIEKVNFLHGIQLRNLLVANNGAGQYGGGFYLDVVDGDLNIYMSTITGNTADSAGGGIAFLQNPFNETVEFNSSIIRNNLPDQIDDPAGGFELNYTNVFGGWVGPGTNNIDLDPHFIAAGLYPVDLDQGSPCINAGDPSLNLFINETDLAGRNRIMNDTIDMGAFESGSKIGPTWALDARVWLEGAFKNDNMCNDLRMKEILPQLQPFNQFPWQYEGHDSLQPDIGENITDWLLVDLFDAASPESSCECGHFFRKALFLKPDGTIVETDGQSIPLFIHDFSDSLFMVVRHRNHLDIKSAQPIIEAAGTFHYDFRTDASKAYGEDLAMKELSPGQWGMVAGDINLNDSITSSDQDAWKTLAGKTLYHPADLNFDGQIDNRDKNPLLLNNLGKVSFVPASDTIFSCGETFKDNRDESCYRTVKIGDQCWMAENLNAGYRIDSLTSSTNNDTIEKYCYRDMEENCHEFGGLYQWDELMDYGTGEGIQGICPEGWHIPTDAEWKILEGYIDTQYGPGDPEWDLAGWRGFDAGQSLKSQSGWKDGGNGTNDFGFTAIPAGYREYTGAYFRLTEGAYFWSSSEDGANEAWRRGLHYSKETIHRWNYEKTGGRSVRCLKD
ncbi:MAG: hypothetical protein KQI35_15270 [Bacteroidetes bacterium]|nr:hypothetical protein [Bacteroidota bacterium]